MNPRWVIRSLIFALGILQACAHYPTNTPLQSYTPEAGYRFDALESGPGNTDTIFLCLTFSGGGTRAAALAYAVLQELRDTTVSAQGTSRALLQEVDCISSVSGGSFTSAYYALFHDRIFQEFESRFLRRDIQGELIGEVLNPVNWFRLMSPYFNRIDLAAELYDTTVFEHKRYRDLIGHRRPFIILNATNVALGNRFEFTQDQFDFLGSDLGEYPIARAAAASSAFPILLSPVSLKNQPSPPGYEVPASVRNAMNDPTTNPRRYLWAKQLMTYQDKVQHPYLHLLDGGLGDNIGLRAVADAYTRGFIRRRINTGAIETLAIIVVNARTDPPEYVDLSESPPRLPSVAMKTATVSMDNFSFETIEFMRGLVGDRSQAQQDIAACQRLLDTRCPGGPRLTAFPREVNLHVIEVNFENLQDPKEREFFLGLPTSFALSNHQVDCLIAAGRKLLRASSDYQALLADLGGQLRDEAVRASEFPPGGCKSPE
jgi:NTE family protein